MGAGKYLQDVLIFLAFRLTNHPDGVEPACATDEQASRSLHVTGREVDAEVVSLDLPDELLELFKAEQSAYCRINVA